MAALESLAAATPLAAVVRVAPRGNQPASIAVHMRRLARWALRRGTEYQMARIARAHGAPLLLLRHANDDAVWKQVAALQPELLLVAGCPWIFPQSVLDIPHVAAVNVHPSLLPRHRGLLPYPWIYHHNDRTSGVTAHCMVAQVDEGAVLAQHAFSVERGMSVLELDRRNAASTSHAVADAIAALRRGERGLVQSEPAATRAPRVRPGDSLVDCARWPAERVWHVLAGLQAFFREPLCDEYQRPVSYASVLGFATGSTEWPTGTVRLRGSEGLLACQDGWVRLAMAGA